MRLNSTTMCTQIGGMQMIARIFLGITLPIVADRVPRAIRAGIPRPSTASACSPRPPCGLPAHLAAFRTPAEGSKRAPRALPRVPRGLRRAPRGLQNGSKMGCRAVRVRKGGQHRRANGSRNGRVAVMKPLGDFPPGATIFARVDVPIPVASGDTADVATSPPAEGNGGSARSGLAPVPMRSKRERASGEGYRSPGQRAMAWAGELSCPPPRTGRTFASDRENRHRRA